VQSAIQSTATRALLDGIEGHVTGRYVIGAGPETLEVQLVDGCVVAACSPRDVPLIVERLCRMGVLRNNRASRLRAMAGATPMLGDQGFDPIFGLLIEELSTRVLTTALRERFEENLCQFVAADVSPRIESTPPSSSYVFPVQHSSDLVQQAANRMDVASQLDDHLHLFAGPTSPNDPASRKLFKAIPSRGCTVYQLIERVPLEPTLARSLIVECMEVGAIRSESMEEIAGDPPSEASVDLTEELDAFSGASDNQRGGASSSFSTETHNLDRVELIDSLDDPSGPNGRSSSYGAPVISESDAIGKIQVANDVLLTAASVVDDVGGDGRGAAMIQLLTDGRPARFAPLFDGLKVRPDGQLPPSGVLRNLARRPPAEQRHLLNKGLEDLLDRTLDRLADALPEPYFDSILTNVAGYRQRLGL